MTINPLDPVSSIIGNFMDRIDTSMQKAVTLADELLMSACEDADILVQNTSFAFKDDFSFAFNKLEQTAQNSLAQIDSLINDIENRTFTEIDDIMNRSQQIVNTLPFCSSDPQLRKFTPKFIVSSQMQYPVTVNVEGNFIDASKSDCVPQLKVNGQTYQVSENTTQSLKFIVPATILSSADNAGYSFIQANIIIPYGGNYLDIQRIPQFIKDLIEEAGMLPHDGNLLDIGSLPHNIKDFLDKEGLFHHNEANFRIMIGTLPTSPGKITLLHNTPQSSRSTKHIITQSWVQLSSDDDIPDHPEKNLQPYKGDPIEPGWTVDPSSIQFIREKGTDGRCLNDKPGADHWGYRYQLIRSYPVVTYGVATVHQCFYASGKVYFHFEYDIYQDTLKDNWTSEEVSLKWGESKTYDYQTGYWKVIFKSFDGKESNEFEGVGNDDRHFLTISAQNLGKTLVLKAADPQTLISG